MRKLRKSKRIVKSEADFYKLRSAGNGLTKQENGSDMWLVSKLRESGLLIEDGPYKDRINYPLKPYIPDCVNLFYRYVVECDDLNHRKPKYIKLDRKKDEFYTSIGYTVIRVEAYNEDDWLRCRDIIKNIRDNKPTLGHYV